MPSRLSTSGRTIVGTDDRGAETLCLEVADGAKFVIYHYVISAVVVSTKYSSPIYFIPPGNNRILAGLRYTAISLLCGWWHKWGFILTFDSIVRNFEGGEDVTAQVMADIAPDFVVDADQRSSSVHLPRPSSGEKYALKSVLLGLGAMTVSLVSVLAFIYLSICLYRGRHLSVALVSGLPANYDITIRGQSHTLRPGEIKIVDLPEGEITLDAVFPQGNQETQLHRLSTPFFTRPFSRSLALINPDGIALVYGQKIVRVYSESDSRPKGDLRSSYQFGETSYLIVKPDNLRSIIAQSIYLSSNGPGLLQHDSPSAPAKMSAFLTETFGPPAAVRYFKGLTRFDPKDRQVLAAAVQTLRAPDCAALLKSRLADRPVLVEWHRTYQKFMEATAPQTDLVAQYIALVAAEPDNSDLRDLLARIQPHSPSSP